MLPPSKNAPLTDPARLLGAAPERLALPPAPEKLLTTKGPRFIADESGNIADLSSGRGNLNTVGKQGPIELPGNIKGQSPKITPSDIMGKSRPEIRNLAESKELIPASKTDPIEGLPVKWKDPVTNKERLRLDRGHIDKVTGLPYSDPKAAGDHVHGYEPDGKTKLRDPSDNNPHFPTRR